MGIFFGWVGVCSWAWGAVVVVVVVVRCFSLVVMIAGSWLLAVSEVGGWVSVCLRSEIRSTGVWRGFKGLGRWCWVLE